VLIEASISRFRRRFDVALNVTQIGGLINGLFTKVLEPGLTVSWLLMGEQNC